MEEVVQSEGSVGQFEVGKFLCLVFEWVGGETPLTSSFQWLEMFQIFS